ncbi:sulfatase [Maribacter sp. HTCC2170]|uniref:sulfatase n=1 Tax=Maribacter sp. (strain HTCC2170 / KCCM 42371) TaxID=313603 RepID=UPI000311884E|nr:sulfatase [Maribacter sp. HTCC2170]
MRFSPTHLFLLVLSIVFLWSCGDKRIRKPNIVLINIDDLGYKDVGFMGSEYYETPNIDILAKAGMIFTNGYAAASNCAPSRASLMTGKWTPRHGIYTVNSSERGKSKDRKIIPSTNTSTLSKESMVLPEVLQLNNYKTIHAGKWHLSESPLDYGFDINIGGGHNGHPKSYYPPYGNVKLRSPNKEYLTDLIARQTIEVLNKTIEPFFLNYAPYAVHTPIQPVDSILSKYNRKTAWKGQNNAKYATMVENLDRNIGLLIAALKDNGHYKNTLIIFTSDNGGLYGITKQQPLRAGKGSYYEGGIREPFFFMWNDKIKSNTKSNVPISHLDLFPSIVEAAGISYNETSLDGNSLLPILKQESTKLKRPLFWHFPIYLEAYNQNDNENRDSLFRTRPGSVIREGDWKLHYYFENNEMELYNLTYDVGERNNLINTHPKKAKVLLQQLKAWWKETSAPIPEQLNPEYASLSED